jgi:hypothetical protein
VTSHTRSKTVINDDSEREGGGKRWPPPRGIMRGTQNALLRLAQLHPAVLHP